MDPQQIAFGVLLAIALGYVVLAVSETLRTRTRIKRRLEGIDRLAAAAEADDRIPVVAAAHWQEDRNAFAALLDSRYPLAGGARTGVVMLVCALVSGVALVPAIKAVGVPLTLAAIFGLLLAGGIGWQVGGAMEHRQRLRFTDRLLVAIEEFQRMARFGVATGQAFSAMAASAEEPVQASLRQVSMDADLGVPLAAALDREAKRVRISELAMLAAIFATQARTGGGLAESVRNLADMLRERIDNRARAKAATSESKISLIILTFVPFAAVGIQAASQPDLFETLLGDARHLLGIGVGLIAAGLAVAWFLVRSVQK